MRAGELRHRVSVERSTGTVSPTGGVTPGEPVTVATGIPFAIDALDIQSYASERLAAGGMQGTTMYRARCRYRVDLTGRDVLLEECCTQRRLEILSIAPTARNEALEMLCIERLL